MIAHRAKQAGVSADDIVCEALLHVGQKVQWRSNATRPKVETKEQFVAALDEIAARCANREPILDHLSADEIIGYDDFGLPR